MPSSHPLRWILLLMFGALSAFGCVGSDTGDPSESGSLALDLVIGDGIVINEVQWRITGNGMDMSGSIDVSAPGSTASVEVFGLPVGDEEYTVELTALSDDEEVACKGSTTFNVMVGETTDVMVVLNCKLPETLGSVRVNGKFNICAQLTKATAAPLQTSVGNDIDLTSEALDAEGDPIHYIWTATGGSIADPGAPSTTYTCQEAGDHTITIQVTDNDEYCNMATWTFPVTCVPADGDLCEDVVCEDDGNECTAEACNPVNGQCETSNVADGTDCDGGAGTCEAGACVATDLCMDVVCEDDGNECTAEACNPANGQCETSNVADDTDCDGGAGTCQAGTCVASDLCMDVVCEDDGNECTAAACNPANGQCETSNVANGTACNDDTGTCNEGVCEATAQVCYEQSFESLDPADGNALSGDGWLYFGNVFDGTGAFKFGFGPFAAPTVSGQISAIASGEGGPDQGTNQLVVFSNYDCCGPGTTNEGHFNGTDMVETIVFQEINPIPADFIDQIFEFSFDAKRGNIEGATTAQAFIRTLDPGAGFATTNNIVVDTSDLPVDWNRLTISLDLSNPLLEGQILQFGFSTIASNFEGAGNFYDNVLATKSPE